MDRAKAGLRISVENILSPAGFTEYPQTVLTPYKLPRHSQGLRQPAGSSWQRMSEAKMPGWRGWMGQRCGTVTEPQCPVVSLQHPPSLGTAFPPNCNETI